MSMDGKRFGVGLAAGLLVALAIVGASGVGGGSLSASLTKGGAPYSPPGTTTGSTTTSASTTAALVANETSNASSGSHAVSSTTVPQSGNTNASAVVTAITTTSISSSTQQVNYFGPASQNASPSRLASIAVQPALSTAFVAVPVLVALLLGAVLYRVSVKARGEGAADPEEN